MAENVLIHSLLWPTVAPATTPAKRAKLAPRAPAKPPANKAKPTAPANASTCRPALLTVEHVEQPVSPVNLASEAFARCSVRIKRPTALEPASTSIPIQRTAALAARLAKPMDAVEAPAPIYRRATTIAALVTQSAQVANHAQQASVSVLKAKRTAAEPASICKPATTTAAPAATLAKSQKLASLESATQPGPSEPAEHQQAHPNPSERWPKTAKAIFTL